MRGDAIGNLVNMNAGNHPLVREYGTWQKFNQSAVLGSNCDDKDNAAIVLEIRDGNIRYCSRRFVPKTSTNTKGYAQKTIPASTEYIIFP